MAGILKALSPLNEFSILFVLVLIFLVLILIIYIITLKSSQK